MTIGVKLTDDLPGFVSGLFRYLILEKAEKLCDEDIEGPRDFDQRWATKKHEYLSIAYQVIVSCMPKKMAEDLTTRRDAILGEMSGAS